MQQKNQLENQHIEKGDVVKDLETNPTTLKELEEHFASGAVISQEEEWISNQ